jgi:hypothetical protein
MSKLDPLFPNPDDFSLRRIHSLDYNSIRNKIIQVLGNGSGTSGYGQTVSSSPVVAGNTITAAQWQALRNDLVNIKLHQEGNVPAIAQVIQGAVIGFGESQPNREFDRIVDQTFTTRFNIGIGRSVVSSGISQSRTGSWSVQSQCVSTVTFSSSDNARFFFNSGGKLRFTSTRTGGVSTAQNNAWTNVLSAAGTQQFSGNISDAENFYKLTDSYRVFYSRSLSTPYSSNFYRIEAKSNVSNNSVGGATVIDFRITWRDDYTDPGPPAPGDLVDGTLTISIEEFKATGSIVPSGSFIIASPSYSITPITAS